MPTRTRKLSGVLALLLLLIHCVSLRPVKAAATENTLRAKAALRSGDYAKALEYFESALKDPNPSEEAQAGLLKTLRETGAFAEAIKRAEVFLLSSDASAILHLERGRLAELVGDYAVADKHYRRSCDLASKKTGVLIEAKSRLAGLLVTTGRNSDAEELWNQILDEYRQGNVQGSSGLGIAALAAWKLGSVESAKDIFMDATEPMIGYEVSLEALSNFGYLFLEKYNTQEALGVFKDCLKINKSYPDALLGVALAKKYDSNAEAAISLQAAIRINPNFTSALNMTADIALDEEFDDSALEVIEKALSVNPSDLESLSLKAAHRYLHSDKTGYAEIEKKILEINPGYGNFYYILADKLVSRKKYQEAVEFGRKAIALDPELWAVYASLGMNLTRIGEMEAGRESMQKAFAGDPFNVWAFNFLKLFDQMDSFVPSRSEHFNFIMSKEDDAVLSYYASSLAEEAYAKLTERYGFKPQGPIQAEIFPDHGGFAVRIMGLPGMGGALGVCFGKVLAINSPRARSIGDFNWGVTLWHEFAHVIALQMSNYNVPRWLTEGLSVYEEQRAHPGWGERMNFPFIKAYKEGKLLNASQLNSGIVRPQTPEQITFSYYQAGLFCEMVEKKYGFDKLRQALLLFAQNKSTEEVFRQTLGLDMAQVDAEYNRFLDFRFKELSSYINPKFADSGTAENDKEDLLQLLEKIPDDFFLNMRMGVLLNKEGSNAKAEPYFKKAQKLFPEYVGPGNSYQALSQMYLDAKRMDEALAELSAWSRVDGDSTFPLLNAAKIYGERKDWDSAFKMLKLSIYINPYSAEAQQQLGEAATELRQWPDAIAAYRVLVNLKPLDPAGAHYYLARTLFAAGDKDQAKKEILQSLEAAPGFNKAQKLLLEISGAPK